MFAKFDDLLKGLQTEGLRKGYKSDAKFSSLYDYFGSLHNSSTTYGVFHGDFLPYNEPKEKYEDFWTGYYSTRIHLKRYIRHTFNQIQSFKTLLAIEMTRTGDIQELDSRFSDFLEQILDNIQQAERNWSIMMHHDAITGTHEYETEPSYYQVLNASLTHLDKAMERFSTLKDKVSQSGMYLDMKAKIPHAEKYSYLLVNPSATARHEIMNITLPKSDVDMEYIFALETIKSSNPPEAYIAEIHELDEESYEYSTVKKIFFPLEMSKLSTARVYIFAVRDKSICEHEEFTCVKKITPNKVEKEHRIENEKISLDFDKSGSLVQITKKFEDGPDRAFPIKEEVTYFRTDSGSRSGHYIFNPMKKRQTIKPTEVEIYEYRIGGLATLYQVYAKDSNNHILKTFSVNTFGCKLLQEQFALQFEFFSQQSIEASLSLKLSDHGKGAKFTSYADDSMKLIERPIYNKKVNIKRHNDIELTGYFTYACVHGGAMKKTTSEGEIMFGWVNSNPIGCTFSENNRVDMMIHRKFSNNGNTKFS